LKINAIEISVEEIPPNSVTEREMNFVRHILPTLDWSALVKVREKKKRRKKKKKSNNRDDKDKNIGRCSVVSLLIFPLWSDVIRRFQSLIHRFFFYHFFIKTHTQQTTF